MRPPMDWQGGERARASADSGRHRRGAASRTGPGVRLLVDYERFGASFGSRLWLVALYMAGWAQAHSRRRTVGTTDDRAGRIPCRPCPALRESSAASAEGHLTRSDWKLENRLVGPATDPARSLWLLAAVSRFAPLTDAQRLFGTYSASCWLFEVGRGWVSPVTICDAGVSASRCNVLGGRS